MTMNAERWWLRGAYAVIFACGVAGIFGIQASNATVLPAPPVTPSKACLNEPLQYTPPEIQWGKVVHGKPVVVEGWAPEIKVLPPRPPPPPVSFLIPSLLYSGNVGMDRAVIEWKLKEPDLRSGDGVKRERSAPKAIVIHRITDDGEVDAVFLLNPKETSFTDKDVRPNHSYRYRVFVRGDEGMLSQASPTIRTIDKEGEGSVEGRVPEWHKVVLMGGDREHAILQVESYNPVKGAWESRILRPTPGQPIGETGWTLKGLRFDKFTLEAVLVDERLDQRVISTKKK